MCLLSGCAKPLLVCPRVVKVSEPPSPEQHPAPVLFATDRVPESREKLGFGGELNLSGTRMSYGIKCEDPAMGHEATCQKPPWLKEELPAGLEKDAFLDEIWGREIELSLACHCR